MGNLELEIKDGITDFTDVELTKDLRPEEVQKKDPNKKVVSTWVNTFMDLDYQIPRDKAVQARVDSVLKLHENKAEKRE
jgi:hypothetical protein